MTTQSILKLLEDMKKINQETENLRLIRLWEERHYNKESVLKGGNSLK